MEQAARQTVFGALRVRLQCIISGNSRLFGRHFHLFLFFPAGQGVFGALRVRLQLARIESDSTVRCKLRQSSGQFGHG